MPETLRAGRFGAKSSAALPSLVHVKSISPGSFLVVASVKARTTAFDCILCMEMVRNPIHLVPSGVILSVEHGSMDIVPDRYASRQCARDERYDHKVWCTS